MPKKTVFKDYNIYVVLYFDNGVLHSQTCSTASVAVNVYRQYRGIYGDSCCLTKVVINYGEEI